VPHLKSNQEKRLTNGIRAESDIASSSVKAPPTDSIIQIQHPMELETQSVSVPVARSKSHAPKSSAPPKQIPRRRKCNEHARIPARWLAQLRPSCASARAQPLPCCRSRLPHDPAASAPRPCLAAPRLRQLRAECCCGRAASLPRGSHAPPPLGLAFGARDERLFGWAEGI
jgi:hypothetical protein